LNAPPVAQFSVPLSGWSLMSYMLLIFILFSCHLRK
jgi:hypothetical protein